MPRKQRQKQKQVQRQVVNINLGKSTSKPKRKYTRRTQTRVVQQQPIHVFSQQPYQLTPQVFIRPPTHELEIPTLGSQQSKKNTVGEIKMDIPEPPKPELKQYVEPPLSEYTKPSPKPPTANIINQPPRLSGLQEAITAQRQRMRKVIDEAKPQQENPLITEMTQAREKLKPSKREQINEIGEKYKQLKESNQPEIPSPFAPKKRGPNKSTMERQQMGNEDININRVFNSIYYGN